ncbi:toll/interleukin-1 receptor domain-containing protein [Geodermatophilus nigrescens]|uniref:toll/interleukin-1 receptor domain-containing protein n=1 Tax=Geodermatophilus sp. FMUSA9-8 TaxID=3120155 RepID=UPI00300B2D80
MTARLFLSHSFADGRDAAERIAEDLAVRTPDCAIWSPTQELRLGHSWFQQVAQAFRTIDAVLLVMTEDALRDDSQCRTECIVAQREGVPVVPVRVDGDVTLYPRFVLPQVVWVDLVRDPDEGLRTLVREVDRVVRHGAARQVVPEVLWRAAAGPVVPDGGVFVGRWLVTRDLRPGERAAVIPDAVLVLQSNNRFEERVTGRLLGRLSRQIGSWGYDPRLQRVTLVESRSHLKVLQIDGSYGPNVFGGTTGGRRFRAQRMLEL